MMQKITLMKIYLKSYNIENWFDICNQYFLVLHFHFYPNFLVNLQLRIIVIFFVNLWTHMHFLIGKAKSQ